MDRLERELSRFRPNSDITRVNHLAAGESARVGASALECLLIARHLYELTGGAFDISIGTGLPSLELDADDFLVRATTDGVRVDLGGIGKGYAVDLVAELLEEWGLERALVHGGFSSILALDAARGPRRLAADAQRSWRAVPGACRASRCARRRSVLPACARGTTSWTRARACPFAGGSPPGSRCHARIGQRPSLRQGPAPSGFEGPRLAPAAVADALTTAFMVLSAEEIAALCERSPGLEAWILPDGELPGAADLLHFGGRAEHR